MPDHKTRQTARIVEAALRIVHADGLSRVSIAKVAAEAGVTRQTVYNYFPDVESIVAQVLDEHSAAMERHLLAVMDAAEGPLEKLRAFAEFQITHAAPEHAGLGLEPALSAEVRARVAAHTDVVKGALERTLISGIEARVVAEEIVPAVAAQLLWGMVEGAVQAAMKYPDQKPYLLDAIMNAMRATISSE